MFLLLNIHGGRWSTTAHNELLKIIDTSNDYDAFVRRVNNWQIIGLKEGVKHYQKVRKLSKMEVEIMIKQNKVSLWLGFYQNIDDFKNYIKVSYDEDGNYVPSNFQKRYAIKKYDLDGIESDWISEKCSDVESLLAGFSGDYEIIPQFEKMLEHKNIQNYNSIVLLYNFSEYGFRDACIKAETQLQNKDKDRSYERGVRIR